MPAPEPAERPQVSTRDRAEIVEHLERWFAGRRPGSAPRVLDATGPGGTGMSSDTLLFTLDWGDGATEQLVARLAPDAAAVPVFPEYDLGRQYRTMATVRDRSDVPVPPLWAHEPDPGPLGTEFLVMGRVAGRVPTDIPPYTFGDGWVADATDAERARMQSGVVGVLAGLHGIADAPTAFPWLPGSTAPDALRAHVDEQRAYARWVLDGRDGPLIARGFAWLEERWPDGVGPGVLSWGDARIGNVLFDGFTPVAVLDWEMAAIAPREVDVAWTVYLHRFFDDLAQQLGLPGLPNLLRRDAVVAEYEARAGVPLADLDWFTAYAAVRHAVIMTRVGLRQVHFGAAPMPDDVDALVTHRASLEAMLAGTYWDSVPR